MKKAIIIASLGLFVAVSFVAAQTTSNTSSGMATSISPWCRGFNNNLTLGSGDVSSNSEVSALQNFLVSKQMLNIPAGVSTGYFGFLTKAALANFQASVGVTPPLGYFGPITRAWFANFCRIIPSGPVSISSVSPSGGPVHTQVTIMGSGFTQDNRVRFAGGGAVHVASSNSGTRLYFTIPDAAGPCDWEGDTSVVHCLVAVRQITPGQYSLSVENQNGISNEVTFTVTSPTSDNQTPVINGVSAPTTLNVDQEGTWKVSASDPHNDQLSYSVDWGDPICSRYDSCGAYLQDDNVSPSTASFQQSATFTHSYSEAGTYVQTFTVRNSSGKSAWTSTTVRVGNPVTTSDLYLNSMSPTSGPPGSSVTLKGTGFTANNVIYFGGYRVTEVSSSGNSTLSFVVPSQLRNCNSSGTACTNSITQVNPGEYSVYISNSNGTSNSLKFTVTDPCSHTPCIQPNSSGSTD